MASHRDCVSDMRDVRSTQRGIDEEEYRREVLRSLPELTEDELDYRLEFEARAVGLHIEPPFANNLSSSTTIASDLQQPMSAISHSTGPTSCSSSEQQQTHKSDVAHLPSEPSRPVTPSGNSITEKRASSFRNGFRRMSVFRKRRSVRSSMVLTPMKIEQGVEHAIAIDGASNKASLEGPQSTTSEKSMWSAPLPQAARETTMDLPSEANEITGETVQCVQLQHLQVQQRDERDRFLEYQRKCLDSLRMEHEMSKSQRLDAQTTIIREARAKVILSQSSIRFSLLRSKLQNEKSLADLESRQLEAEMHLMSDLEAEKRTCLIRLRHMEAYCRSPPSPSPSPCPSSPPLTPPPSASDRSSLDYSSLHHGANSSPIPTSNPNLNHHHSRKITEKDFHNLAQQYRSRDTMESLHRARIEVLRGRQEKQFSDYAAKKAREIKELEAQQEREIGMMRTEAKAREAELRLAFEEKRKRLERRWRIEVEIEMTKTERGMGVEERVALNRMMEKEGV